MCVDANKKAEVRNSFLDRLKHYEGDNFQHESISVEMVGTLIDKLKKGKAAGIDNITCEHLQYSHPIVTCILTKLFNLMTIFNYVPN